MSTSTSGPVIGQKHRGTRPLRRIHQTMILFLVLSHASATSRCPLLTLKNLRHPRSMGEASGQTTSRGTYQGGMEEPNDRNSFITWHSLLGQLRHSRAIAQCAIYIQIRCLVAARVEAL